MVSVLDDDGVPSASGPLVVDRLGAGRLVLVSDGVPVWLAAEAAPVVAVVSNAKDPYSGAARARKALLDRVCFESAGSRVVPVDLRDFVGDPDGVRRVLDGVDVVWVGGGNSFWLAYLMGCVGFRAVVSELLSSGGTYAGESAGAMVAGSSLVGSEPFDRPAAVPAGGVLELLRLVPEMVLPHADRGEYRARVAECVALHQPSGRDVLCVEDGVAVVVESGCRSVRLSPAVAPAGL
jgi:dipeptidase E